MQACKMYISSTFEMLHTVADKCPEWANIVMMVVETLLGDCKNAFMVKHIFEMIPL